MSLSFKYEIQDPDLRWYFILFMYDFDVLFSEVNLQIERQTKIVLLCIIGLKHFTRKLIINYSNNDTYNCIPKRIIFKPDHFHSIKYEE